MNPKSPLDKLKTLAEKWFQCDLLKSNRIRDGKKSPVRWQVYLANWTDDFSKEFNAKTPEEAINKAYEAEFKDKGEVE